MERWKAVSEAFSRKAGNQLISTLPWGTHWRSMPVSTNKRSGYADAFGVRV